MTVSRHENYRKWLRYYLDFRGKYSIPDSKSEHVRLFIEKLRNKDQTPEQQKQAAHALSLFFESQLQKIYNETPPVKINTEKTVTATTPSTPRNRVVPAFIKQEVGALSRESAYNLSRDAATPRSSSHPPDSGDIGQVSIPPTSAGKRFN